MATLTVGALAIACVALPSAAVRVVMQRTGELYDSVAVAPDPSLCRGAEALTPGADCVDGPYLGLRPDPLGDWEQISVLHGMGCATDNLLPTVKSCVFGDPDGAVSVALVGDSHAMKLWPALKVLAEAEGWRLVTYLKAQCEYASPTMEGTDNCKEWRADVAAQLDAAGPWDLVVTTGASHMTGPPGAADAFRAVWQPLIDDGAQLVDVRDVPYLATDIRSCVVDHLEHLSACDRPRVDAVLDDTMARTAGELAGASVIDLTDDYSRSLAPAIGTQLRSIAPELFAMPSK